MQVKTIMRYHFTPVNMVIIKKKLQTINSGEGMEKRETFYIIGGNVQWVGNVHWCNHYGRQYGGIFKTKI